jgi:hypothetical protein
MSFAAFLRAPIETHAIPKRAARRQHVYEAKQVDAQIDDGQRIEVFMKLLYGAERSADMMQQIARRAGRERCPPALILRMKRAKSPKPGDALVDLVTSDSDGNAKTFNMPKGFWKRFMEEDLHVQYTNRKKCS